MKSRYVVIFTAAFFIVMLIIYPEKYITSVSDGLNLYAVKVLPALFPFMFFGKILSELNFGYDVGKAMRKPVKKLYNAPGIGGYALIMSMLSGYPVGAKTVAELYEKNLISAADARKISTFTSTSGPLFIVGTVGIIMLNNKAAGFAILASHYAGAVLNGLLYRGKKKDDTSVPLLPPLVDNTRVMSDSITNSVLSVAIVGGYIAIFCMALDVVSDFGVIRFFAKLFPLLSLDYNLGIGFFSSLVEITKGCLIMSKSGASMRFVVPLCSFSIAFGGLSITLQSLTFLSKCKIKPAFYLLGKFTQAVISAVISIPLAFLV
ncbi:MAG TPA: hypothetical protein PKY53_07115 [Clostridia bacterium]|nr:hypothetical protein [Clostridia bacterium]